MFRLPSYRKCSWRDGHCYYGDEAEPCWGQVEMVGEDCTEDYSDCWDHHACEGHFAFADSPLTEKYRSSDRPEDQGVAPVDDDE